MFFFFVTYPVFLFVDSVSSNHIGTDVAYWPLIRVIGSKKVYENIFVVMPPDAPTSPSPNLVILEHDSG